MDITLSKSGNHLIFSETKFDKDGIEESSNFGALKLEAGKDRAKQLAAAKKMKWNFVGKPDNNGFTQIERA